MRALSAPSWTGTHLFPCSVGDYCQKLHSYSVPLFPYLLCSSSSDFMFIQVSDSFIWENSSHQVGICCWVIQKFVKSLLTEIAGSQLGWICVLTCNLPFFLRNVLYCQEFFTNWVAYNDLISLVHIEVHCCKDIEAEKFCPWNTWSRFYFYYKIFLLDNSLHECIFNYSDHKEDCLSEERS